MSAFCLEVIICLINQMRKRNGREFRLPPLNLISWGQHLHLFLPLLFQLGSTGPLATNINAFIVNFTTTALIPQGTGIPLDANLILTSGITHIPGSSVINLDAGTYLVEYNTVSQAPTANFVSTRALLNGSTIAKASVVSPQVAPGTFQSLSTGFIVIAPDPVNTLEIAADSQGGNIYNSQFASIPNVSVRIVKIS